MTDPGDEHRDENLVTRLRSLKLDAADEAVREIMRLQSLHAWTTKLLEQQSERCAVLSREVGRLRAMMPSHIARILYEGSG
jgi:hypothetical protein